MAHRWVPVAFVALILSVACQPAAKPHAAATAATKPGLTPSPSATPVPTFWSEQGPLLTAADFGFPGDVGDLGFADPEIVRLPDGRFRLYMFMHGGASSMVSADGLHWTLEPGRRCTYASQALCGQMAVVPMPSGGFRIFTNCEGGQGICSGTSQDGLSWTSDAGVRVSDSSYPRSADENWTGPHVVPVTGGGWRMYFSIGPHQGPLQPEKYRVVSAFSTDLVNWAPDSGVRVGGLQHPDVVALPGGGYRMFAHTGFEALTATSADGVSWPAEFQRVGILGGDSAALVMPDGTVRDYYESNDGAAHTGALFWAQNEPASWDVNFAFGGNLPADCPQHPATCGPQITINVTGSGGPVKVRLTDYGRSKDQSAAGLPHTATPPFSVTTTIFGEYPFHPVLEVADGTVNRFFDPNGGHLPSAPVPGCGPVLTFSGPVSGDLCPVRGGTTCIDSADSTYTVTGSVDGFDEVHVVMTVLASEQSLGRLPAGKLADGKTYGVIEQFAGQVQARGQSGVFTRTGGGTQGTIDAVLDDGTHITGRWGCSAALAPSP